MLRHSLFGLAFTVVFLTACSSGDAREASNSDLRTLAATPFSLAAQPVSTRLSLAEFENDPVKMESLRRGVEVMKSRPPSDPTSWFFQAAIHSVSPEAVAAAAERDPKVLDLDHDYVWNQCPHAGQGSANFLIWHRAYLFHFEAILRDAAGDPTLSLPYWDYTNENQRTFPASFAPEFLDETRTVENPLFHPTREFAFVMGLYQLTNSAASDALALAQTSFFGTSDTQGFAGAEADTNPRTKSALERVPHDMLHVAIGGIIDNTSGAMASVPTAAFDPIFWVHHANIDRIWSEWDCKPDVSWGPSPSANWLSEHPWQFYHADGSALQRSRLEYIRLGHNQIVYDDPQTNCPTPLSSTEPTLAPLDKNISLLSKISIGSIVAGSTTPIEVTASERVNVSVPLEMSSTIKRELQSALFGETTIQSANVTLRLNSPRFSSLPSVGYDVHINADNSEVLDRQSVSYVGSVGMFGTPIEGQSAHSHHLHKADEIFDITLSLISTQGEKSTIDVTIVPFDLLEPTTGDARFVRSGTLIVDGLEVELTR